LALVQYEDIYLRDYETVPLLFSGLDSYFQFYNHERSHQSLDYATPAEVYFANRDRSFLGHSSGPQG